MTCRIRLSPSALCAVLVSSACVVPAGAQTIALQRGAVSGLLAAISEERSWNAATCEPQAITVTILEQPTSGAVTPREETLRIPDATLRGGSTGRCSGQPIIGKRLYYQSKPGFVGVDRIVYATSYGGSRAQQTIINITVTNQPVPLPPSQLLHPTVYRMVTSGKSTEIGGVTRWGPGCDPLPPTLVIAEPPKYGVTAIRDEPATIPSRDSNGATVSCAGRPTVRKTLYYQSQPGFQGTDHLVYDTEHGRYRVEIAVGVGSPR